MDVRTGGPVSLRSAVVAFGVRTGWRELVRRVRLPGGKSWTDRTEVFRAEMREIAETHAGDPEAQRHAFKQVKSHAPNSLTACAPAILTVAVMDVPALWSPLNQTLPERLAGIAVIEI